MEIFPQLVIAGASGLIGRSLHQHFLASAVSCAVLTRHTSQLGSSEFFWDPYRFQFREGMRRLSGIRAAIHLSGDNLMGGRWTAAKKQRIRDSRIRTTESMVQLLSHLEQRPEVLLCASAVGIYGDRGDEILSEDSDAGRGFLPDVCREWEQAADAATQLGIRVVHLRFGVVLAREGGALAKMLPHVSPWAGRQPGEWSRMDELDCPANPGRNRRILYEPSSGTGSGQRRRQPGHQRRIHPRHGAPFAPAGHRSRARPRPAYGLWRNGGCGAALQYARHPREAPAVRFCLQAAHIARSVSAPPARLTRVPSLTSNSARLKIASHFSTELEGVSIRPGRNSFCFPQLKARTPSLPVLAWIGYVSIAASLFLLTGCGMEAAPQPPSLNLPKTISSLTATRTGNQVHLAWTMPRENTDHLILKGMVPLRICRTQQAGSPCEDIAILSAAPDKPATYTDVLPPTLTSGPPRPISYRIFGLNKNGRTAGPSNVVDILAGAAPPEVRDLSAQVDPRGVVLHWQPVSNLSPDTSIQIDRTAVTPAAAPSPVQSRTFNPLHRSALPEVQKLRVRLIPPDPQHTATTDPGIALDPTAQFGQEYTYSASRVVQQQVGQQTLQLDSSQSPAIHVATRDTFPPAPPSGLVAIPVAAVMNNGTPEVDLSWSANNEPDLAQYRVYRRDVTGNQPTHRLAPESDAAADAIVAPAYRDLHVQAGQTYTYAVTAVDTSGNESARSAQVTVTVPTS